MQNIVWATDFSDASMSALEWATKLADQVGAVLTLCHVVEPLELTRGVNMADSAPAAAKLERLAKDVENDLGQPVEWRLLEGKPHDRVAEFAREKQALLVMGTVGRSRLARVLVGSVADTIVRQAKCPVMLIPPDWKYT